MKKKELVHLQCSQSVFPSQSAFATMTRHYHPPPGVSGMNHSPMRLSDTLEATATGTTIRGSSREYNTPATTLHNPFWKVQGGWTAGTEHGITYH